MQRDYRLAAYAFGIAMVLFAASGAAVIAGASSSAGPADGPDNDTTTVQLDTDQQQATETVRVANNSEFTLQRAQRTCGGGLRLDTPNRTSTTHQVGDVTVTLVSHHDGTVVEKVGRQRLAERMAAVVPGRRSTGPSGRHRAEAECPQHGPAVESAGQ
ncbi:hypothetical protein [Haloarcula pelagica]|uniref:hypothetical protein n=1 Tax=Haloarcula pelagica TaxID=3033389 RepID=UPI0024C25733|nr:hypothetical protein [Halomicroarcula sp. YJ-61-S]